MLYQLSSHTSCSCPEYLVVQHILLLSHLLESSYSLISSSSRCLLFIPQFCTYKATIPHLKDKKFILWHTSNDAIILTHLWYFIILVKVLIYIREVGKHHSRQGVTRHTSSDSTIWQFANTEDSHVQPWHHWPTSAYAVVMTLTHKHWMQSMQ